MAGKTVLGTGRWSRHRRPGRALKSKGSLKSWGMRRIFRSATKAAAARVDAAELQHALGENPG
jgi:hypothetical protein